MKQLFEQKWLGFLFFPIALIFYWSTKYAKFTSDFFSWVGQFEEYGAKGLLTGFDDPGLHPVYHLATFGMYRLFDLSPMPWFFVFIALHSLNAYLIFRVFGRMLKSISINQAYAISFVAALFFLLSPYQTEAVVWGATIHYLLCVGLSIGSIGLLVKYQESKNKSLAIGSFVCFMLALYALEMALMLPIILIGVLAFVYFKKDSLKETLQTLSLFVLPQFLGIFIYFFHQKMKFGNWVGHYGASTHLNLAPDLVGTTLNRYLLKFLSFFRYIPIEEKHGLYKSSAEPTFAIGILILVGILIVLSLAIIFFFPNKKKTKILLLFFFTFIAGLGPVINLETTSLLDIQSDRYGYFASVFFCLFLSSFFFFLFKRMVWGFAAIWLGISVFLLVETNKSWQAAGIIAKELRQNFTWFDARKVYVLNLPDNFKGAYLLRNGFQESIEKEHNKKVNSRIIRSSWYNWQELEDCVPVKKINETSLKTTFKNPKKWWIYFGAGASSHDKETHSMKKEGLSCTITFKDYDPNQDVIIYPCGTEWKTVDF